MAGSFVPYTLQGFVPRPMTGQFEHSPFSKPGADAAGHPATQPASPATPAAAHSEELAAKLEAALVALPGVTLAKPDLEQAVAAIQGLIRSTPQRYELPQLKLHPATTTEGTANAPQIHLDKVGDAISRIRVTCACGETIAMDCVY